ncbi:hypothetical protein ACHAWF_005164 [Thalassiosira exigua]
MTTGTFLFEPIRSESEEPHSSPRYRGNAVSGGIVSASVQPRGGGVERPMTTDDEDEGVANDAHNSCLRLRSSTTASNGTALTTRSIPELRRSWVGGTGAARASRTMSSGGNGRGSLPDMPFSLADADEGAGPGPGPGSGSAPKISLLSSLQELEPPLLPPPSHLSSSRPASWPEARPEEMHRRAKPVPTLLRIALDDECDEQDGDSRPRPPSATSVRRTPDLLPSFPQLRLRPSQSRSRLEEKEKELETPSPLARRGAAERAYLQGQLRAEARQRQRHQRHNEQRKLRLASAIASIDGDHATPPVAVGGVPVPPVPGRRPINGKGGRVQRDPLGSPPAILKATMRSYPCIDKVLRGAGIDEDENLLFFPDGVPLVVHDELDSAEQDDIRLSMLDVDDRDEDDVPLNEDGDGLAADVAREARGASVALDLDDAANADDGSVAGRPASAQGQMPGEHESPRETSPSSSASSSEDEISPSLMAADVIWQLGAFCMDDKVNFPDGLSAPSFDGRGGLGKKVTLKPKMNAPKLTGSPSPRPKKPVAIKATSKGVELEDLSSSKENRPQDAVGAGHDDEAATLRKRGFGSPNKFYLQHPGQYLGASESFQQLSFDSVDGTAPPLALKTFDRANSDASCQTLDGSISEPPHPNRPHHPFVYSTPDNSEQFRCPRRVVGWEGRMPKLPELTIDPRASEALDAALREEAEATASSSNGGTGAVLSELLSEWDRARGASGSASAGSFRTPDSYHRSGTARDEPPPPPGPVGAAAVTTPC